MVMTSRAKAVTNDGVLDAGVEEDDNDDDAPSSDGSDKDRKPRRRKNGNEEQPPNRRGKKPYYNNGGGDDPSDPSDDSDFDFPSSGEEDFDTDSDLYKTSCKSRRRHRISKTIRLVGFQGKTPDLPKFSNSCQDTITYVQPPSLQPMFTTLFLD